MAINPVESSYTQCWDFAVEYATSETFGTVSNASQLLLCTFSARITISIYEDGDNDNFRPMVHVSELTLPCNLHLDSVL